MSKTAGTPWWHPTSLVRLLFRRTSFNFLDVVVFSVLLASDVPLWLWLVIAVAWIIVSVTAESIVFGEGYHRRMRWAIQWAEGHHAK